MRRGEAKPLTPIAKLFVVVQFAEEPSAGKRPVSLDGRDRNAQTDCDFGNGHPGEVPELDDVGFHRIAFGEPRKCLVECD